MTRLIQMIMVIPMLVGILSKDIAPATGFFGGCAYQPSFSDEFNGTSLDTSRWSTSYPSGNGGEQQWYSPDAITVQGGILKITAEKQTMHGYPYTSGIITTQGTFAQKYGLFSIRAKLPKGQGFWPAFWMLPAKSAYPSEIDIFELLGGDPHTIYMSNHWRDANQVHQKKIVPFQGPDFSQDFHIFTLLWNPGELIWYVDGVERYRTTEGVPNMPMFLLVNLAVGGDWPGNPNTKTPFPNSMEIDYIHVYQYQCHSSLLAVVKPYKFSLYIGSYESTTLGEHYY